MIKDKEYFQELAYLEAEKEEMFRKEMRELDQARKPAKIIIEYKNGKKYRKLNKSDFNTFSVHRNT